MNLPALHGSCGFAALGRQVPALVCHFKNLAGSGVHLFLLDLFFRRGISAECHFQTGYHVAGFWSQLAPVRGSLGAYAWFS